MKKLEDVVVGDTVWVVDEANGRNRPPAPITVTKVGTKRITTDFHYKYQFDKETGRIIDNYGHHYIYANEGEYERKKKHIDLINKIQRANTFAMLTFEETKIIAGMLGIDYENP